MAPWSTSLLPLGEPPVAWMRLEGPGSHEWVTSRPEGLSVSPAAITALTRRAFEDVAHLLRPSHLSQLALILEDPEASVNDRAVALDLLKNASVSAGGILPMCQDTGTAMVYAKRGHRILTNGEDAEYIEAGILSAFREKNLRYSQLAPLGGWEETNTGSNLPAEVDIQLGTGEGYDFLFIAKGGGSANKTFLFQETKELLREEAFLKFMETQLRALGTTACPPYHLAVVIGGTSADFTLKTAKLAAAHALDTLPTKGSPVGHGFRDIALEAGVLQLTRDLGIGAQFGGKYFCHDVRVVRLPRHTGSLPVAIAVSCSADRQAYGRITSEGVFLEKLETDPARFLSDKTLESLAGAGARELAREIDLNAAMPQILSQLSGLPVGSRVTLTGRMVVARDLAHAAIRDRMARGEGMPDYLRRHPVYYAAPAKTPEGYPSGSFGPTTGGRMDGYVEEFQAAEGSLVMLAKGNRSPVVAESCRRHGGVYLAAVGGPAALIASENIRHLEILDFPELGLEAVYAVDVVSFPAYVVIDAEGRDLFGSPSAPTIRLGATRLKETKS